MTDTPSIAKVCPYSAGERRREGQNGGAAQGERACAPALARGKGSALIAVVPEQIQSPAMPAKWEEKLPGIEKGGYTTDDFMQEITRMVTDLVKNYETVKTITVRKSAQLNATPTPA